MQLKSYWVLLLLIGLGNVACAQAVPAADTLQAGIAGAAGKSDTAAAGKLNADNAAKPKAPHAGGQREKPPKPVQIKTEKQAGKQTAAAPAKPDKMMRDADAKAPPEKAAQDTSDTVLQYGRHGAQRIYFHGNAYDCIVADLDHYQVRLHLLNRKGKKYNALQALLADTAAVDGKEIIMCTNAGMYTTETDPQGLYIEAGRLLKHLDTLNPQSGDNFHLKPNGVYYMDSAGAHIDTTEYYQEHVKHKVFYATQSGPMLVINERIHPAFKQNSQNVNIRSGVGLINNKKVVFAISHGTTNFYDFALLFKQHFKCANALYLDGAISRMYLPALKVTDTGGNFGPIISVTEK